MIDDWQAGEVVFAHAPPPWDGHGVRFSKHVPPLDGRGVTFDYLKANQFHDVAEALSTAEAATDDEGWSIRSLYYGGGAIQTNSKKPLILTERASEARGAYIYEVKFQPGYTVNVDALRSADGINYHGRARYLVFLDRIIAVHPDEDLKIVGRRKLKVLKYNPFHDELGRFASGDSSGGNTIEADIAQAIGGGELPLKTPFGYKVVPNGDKYEVWHLGSVIGTSATETVAQQFAIDDSMATDQLAGGTPNYPLPTGYTIMPQADESTGIVDYQVYQEGHGVIGQFNDNNAAQRFAVEHAASQPELTLSTSTGTTTSALEQLQQLPGHLVVEPAGAQGFKVTNDSGTTLTYGHSIEEAASNYLQVAGVVPETTSVPIAKPEFVPGAEHLPAGYKVEPGTNPGGYSWKVVNAEGAMAGGGFNQAEALHDFFYTHPDAMLPAGYSLNINHEDDTVQITDPTGKTVYDHEYNISGYEAAAAFMNTHTGGTGKPTIGVEHLPTGYKLETGEVHPFNVVSVGGYNVGHGNTEQEALDSYFYSYPNKALPQGYSTDYNPFKESMTILDEHGTIVHEYHPADPEHTDHLAYDAVAAYLAGAPSTFAGGAGEPQKFMPGVEHLPHDVHLNENAGGYSPVKVIGAGGEVLGAGDTKEEALKEYFTYHAGVLLPPGYQVGYDHIIGGPIIVDPTGKEVYTGKAGQGGYQATLNYLSENPQLQPSAVVGAGTVTSTASQTKVIPGINDLPKGYELQESTSGGGGNNFHVVHPDGYWVGAGKTPEQALHSFYDQHPKLALPEGFTLTHNYDTQGSDIINASGQTVYTSPTFVHGYDAVVAYMTHEANKEQEVTSTLGTLPETYFGAGRPSLEPLTEAGLPPGFNVTHDTEGESHAGIGGVKPPSVHQLTSDEIDIIGDYTSSGNTGLNRFLRDGTKPDNPGKVDRYIKGLDNVFSDTSSADTQTLYRGISAKAVRKLDEAIANTDGHFTDPGYPSTSTSESTARGWKQGDYVSIKVPAGSKALDIDRLSHNPGEGEWLLGRNQHFRVISKEPSKGAYSSGHWHYTLELINAPVQPKDDRQMDLPFVDRGPVNKQDEEYDPADKFSWDESGIVLDYTYQKYNMEHDALGRFASGDGGGPTIEADIAEATGGGSLPEMSPDGPIVYHGTSQAAIDRIEKEGLQAERGRGANEFIIQHMDPEYSEDRPASVYFAGSPINARMYAKYAGKATGSEPVVIPIRLTKAQAAAMVWDEHGGGAGEMRLQGATIPPSQIGKPAVGMAEIDKLTQNVMGNAKNSKWFSTHVFDPKDTHPPVKLLPKAVRAAGARRVMGKADEADILVFAVLLVDPDKTRPQKTGQGFPDPKVKTKGQGLIDKGQGFLDAEQTYAEVEKYNMWHDLKGLFSSGPGGGGADEHGSTGSAAASDTTIGELISPSHGTEAQREAVSDYTDEGYLDVNNFLRHDEEPRFPNSTQSVIKHLDTILEHSTLPEETTVYRGLSKSATERLQKALDNGNTSFYDKGFISTTASKHYAGVFASSMLHNHAIAVIVLPKGTHARNIADWSSSPDEQETLIARDSAFKVERHDIDENTGLSVYHLRLLPDYDPNQLDLPLGKAKGSTGKFIWSGEEMHFLVEKWNPFHDLVGRFTSGGGGGSVSSEQEGSINFYTGDGYKPINTYLRDGTEPPYGKDRVDQSIKHMDEVIAATPPLRKSEEVYRGLTPRMVERITNNMARNNPNFTDNGFISVTRSSHVANVFASSIHHSNAAAIITLPKGGHALDVSKWSKAPEEQELILPRGSTFFVQRTEITPAGHQLFHMTLLPNQVSKSATGKRAVGDDDKYVWNGDEVTFHSDEELKKYNEEHDERGRFASASGAGAINQVGGAPLESWTDHPTDIAGWAKVEGQMPDLVEPPFHTEHGERTASGVVIREPDGRVWLVHPTNQFGGYNATFPKGGVEPGLSMQANAIKEAYEETGLKVKITGFARDVERTTSKTRYYFAERVGGNPSDHEQHTDHLSLVAPDRLHSVADHPIDAPLIEQIRSTKKYNEYHDAQGLFTHGPEGVGGAGGGGGTEQPGDHRFTAERALTKEEKLGVGMYTATTAYREINEAYRKGFSLKNTPEMQAHANNLVKAIDAHTLKEDITVFRGIRNQKLIDQLDAAVATGNNEFTDRGFASTSFSEHAALEFTTWQQDSTKYLMRINVPKGAHALPASAMGLGSHDEDEVILQHGSRFKIDGRRLDLSNDDGERVIYDAHLVIDE